MVFIMLIFAIVGICTTIVQLRKYANIEYMAMIEKGVDPQYFNVRRPLNTSWALRVSLLLIGGGVGLLLGDFLDRNYHMEEIAYFSMLFICGGIGLGASYLIEEKKLKSEK